MLQEKMLPPFGNILEAYQKQKIRLNYSIYIYLGKSGKDASFSDVEAGILSSFLPIGEPFIKYHFPIFEQKVIVIDSGDVEEKFINKFCFYLMSFKPRIVYQWSDKYVPKFFIRKSL